MAFGKEICNILILNGGFSANPSSFGPMGLDWMMLTLLGSAISIFLMTLAYMFSTILRNQGLTAWTKFELFQAVAGVVLFVAVALMVVGACSFNMGFLDSRYGSGTGPGQFMNMYDVVEMYFDSLKVMGYYLFACLMYVSRMLNMLAKIVWLSSPLGLGMQDSPLESLGQLNSVLFFVVGGFFTSMIMLWLQVRIMDYMAFAALYYMMPFGIFFRTFEPTRKFGGTLMGISLTFILFYPMTIVFNDFIVGTSITEEISGSGINSALNDISGSRLDAGGNSVYVKENEVPEGYEQVKNNPSDVDKYAKISSIGTAVVNGIFLPLRPLMIYAIAAVFLPVINFIVLVETARALTGLLGEEVDVSNLTRMI